MMVQEAHPRHIFLCSGRTKVVDETRSNVVWCSSGGSGEVGYLLGPPSVRTSALKFQRKDKPPGRAGILNTMSVGGTWVGGNSPLLRRSITIC